MRDNLDILFDDGSISDLSIDANSYVSDQTSLTINATDKIYFGYHKPIKSVYVSLGANKLSSNSLVFNYYNGTAFTALSMSDKTKDFSRSGFLDWSNPTDIEETTVNSKEQYWYEIVFDASESLDLNAINLLFSEDNDMLENEPEILSTDFYPDGETSHLKFHVAARSKIFSRLRAEGRGVGAVKINNQITAFDFHDRTELQETSKLYALSALFFNLSDSTEDKWYQRYMDYKEMGNSAYAIYVKSIDIDDDGIEDESEKVTRSFEGRFERE